MLHRTQRAYALTPSSAAALMAARECLVIATWPATSTTLLVRVGVKPSVVSGKKEKRAARCSAA